MEQRHAVEGKGEPMENTRVRCPTTRLRAKLAPMTIVSSLAIRRGPSRAAPPGRERHQQLLRTEVDCRVRGETQQVECQKAIRELRDERVDAEDNPATCQAIQQRRSQTETRGVATQSTR